MGHLAPGARGHERISQALSVGSTTNKWHQELLCFHRLGDHFASKCSRFVLDVSFNGGPLTQLKCASVKRKISY